MDPSESITINRGDLWSAIRNALHDVRGNLKKAAEADRHEEEMIQFDFIASNLTSAVMRRAYSEAAGSRVESA